MLDLAGQAPVDSYEIPDRHRQAAQLMTPADTFPWGVRHGGWQVQQPFPGVYVWRDPHGATYVVDHSGTRRLPSHEHASPAEVGFARVTFDPVA